MINIAIVDDDKYFLNIINLKIVEFLQNNDIKFSIFKTTSPNNLFNNISKNFKYDYIFLDYDMPDMNGNELAKQLRKYNTDFKLIYITSHNDVVFECIRNNIFRFVRKSILDEDLQDCLNALVDQLLVIEPIEFKTTIGNININPKRILYAASENRSIYIYTLEDKYQLKNTTLENVNKLINESFFIYISKGILVNLKNIKTIDNEQIILINGQALYPSRRKKKEVLNTYFDFIYKN